MAKSDIDPDLLKQAEELNIEVTDTATAEAVKEAIDAALAEDAAASIAKLRTDYKELVGKNAFNGWDAEELQKRIDAALAGTSQPPASAAAPVVAASRKPKTLPFKIERDFWDENGERHRKGTIVEMTAEDALAGIESGAISRVKG